MRLKGKLIQPAVIVIARSWIMLVSNRLRSQSEKRDEEGNAVSARIKIQPKVNPTPNHDKSNKDVDFDPRKASQKPKPMENK